ncbi:MAG: prepilin-type N-terminal cleavage/methylation domain-containing protein [Luminiphilus sp.]|nr:prepilin-type N-terminal cleavage/methylation domain-containing protein [Luminiphilus sp.]
MTLTNRQGHWGLTLIELLIVLVITGVLISLAVPSWQGFHGGGVVEEARLVLTRLDLKQRAFRQEHGRYAGESDLPPLASLSPRLSSYYTLQVDLPPDGFQLLLTSGDHNWPSLGLDHLGLWSGSAVGDLASAP